MTDGAGAPDPAVWHDYALFLLRAGDVVKAVECLRAAVSEDASRVPSLLALAAVHVSRDERPRAAEYARAALRVLAPDSHLGGGPHAAAGAPPPAAAYPAVSTNDRALALVLLGIILEPLGA